MDESTNSCGTRSFSCTATADPPARAEISPSGPNERGERQPGQRGALPAEGAALLRELDGLRAILAGAAGARPAPPADRQDRLIVLARFLDHTEAEDTPADHRAENEARDPWFTLELDPEEYPQMRGLCRADAPPLGPVCPVTAGLLPESFLRLVASETDRLIAAGGEATLALFAVDSAPGAFSGDSRPPSEAGSRDRNRRHGNDRCAGATPGGVFPPSVADAPLRVLARLMRRHARACDIPGRPARDHLALLMPGVGPFRARALAERLIAAFREEAVPDGAVLRAGLACCDAEAPISADVLLARAEEALALAQPGFSRTFRKEGAPEPERRTQVQACEKAFLFFGDSEQV